METRKLKHDFFVFISLFMSFSIILKMALLKCENFYYRKEKEKWIKKL